MAFDLSKQATRAREVAWASVSSLTAEATEPTTTRPRAELDEFANPTHFIAHVAQRGTTRPDRWTKK
jgi:hypothetical protein